MALVARYALLAVGAVIFVGFSLAMPGVYGTAGSPMRSVRWSRS
jgi:hypothetical protein